MLVESATVGDPDVVGAWFTGRGRRGSVLPVGAVGNLAHRRPHRPADLARARRDVGDRTGTDPARWHLMHQTHGAAVAVVDAGTPAGREHDGVDALVTREVARPLVVQVADCVPVLIAGPSTVAAVHAGRRGIVAGIVAATIAQATKLGDEPATLEVAVGPAIGGCCYEVPEPLRESVGQLVPETRARTSWGTPSLDLKAGVAAQLGALGVTRVRDVGVCTHCDGRFFSHRRDAASGRQVGMIVRRKARAA